MKGSPRSESAALDYLDHNSIPSPWVSTASKWQISLSNIITPSLSVTTQFFSYQTVLKMFCILFHSQKIHVKKRRALCYSEKGHKKKSARCVVPFDSVLC